jgi:signal transduction histidine kinase
MRADKILVIDDEAVIRHVIRLALLREGFTVLESTNGEEGVAHALRELPNLILCDVRMSGLGGLDVLQKLQAQPATAGIPLILMTGDADQDKLRQGMELGADDFLVKPFGAEPLLAAIEARLRKVETLRQQASTDMEQLRQNISHSVPHELLTPLNGILATAQLIQSDDTLPAETVELAGLIVDSGERLHQLIQRFMSYVQIELMAAHPGELAALRHGASGPVNALLTAAAQQAAAQAERAPDLALELDPADGSVPMLEELFRQVGTELLDNAFKFSSAGTPVRVKTAASPTGWTLTITDSGRGMQPEEIQRIGAFVQFQRPYYEQQGAGLGLAIVRRVTEIHGGSFTLRSEPGVGTEVTLRLPAAPAALKGSPCA